MGSKFINGQGDSQLIVNKDGCDEGELRLCILNHDEGEAAYVVVDAADLERIVREASEA